MKAKLKPVDEIPCKTEQTLVEEHKLSEKDLCKVDAFVRGQKLTGTLRVDYANGGKTTVRFLQEFPVELV